jgi:hypothetical protein
VLRFAVVTKTFPIKCNKLIEHAISGLLGTTPDTFRKKKTRPVREEPSSRHCHRRRSYDPDRENPRTLAHTPKGQVNRDRSSGRRCQRRTVADAVTRLACIARGFFWVRERKFAFCGNRTPAGKPQHLEACHKSYRSVHSRHIQIGSEDCRTN